MSRLTASISCGLLLPILAFGQAEVSYDCSFERLERRVEIFTEPGVSVPCEVHYYKDKEDPGQKQVLWRATNEAGFCEAKTEEFVERLRSWGWTCIAGTRDEAASAPQGAVPDEPAESRDTAATDEAPADDTDALAPAD